MLFRRCPRCNIRGFERFSIYGICHDCNYFQIKKNRNVAPVKIEKTHKDYNAPHPFLMNKDKAQNQFTEEDHSIVKKALLSIPENEQRIVFLYFWKDQKKDEIAEKMQITLEQVERILGSSYERLRKLCLNNPKFSRAIRKFQTAA